MTAKPAFKPTPEQVSCIDMFATGKKLRINAYAGTGKTSTLIQIANSTSRTGTYLAFNKSIADEARRRFPRHVACSTVHGMAFRAVRNRYDVAKMTGGLNGGFVSLKLGMNKRSFVFTKGGKDDPVISLRPRQWGGLLCETVRRFMRSDRPEITAWDVPVEGKVATLDDVTRSRFRAQAAQEARSLWSRMIDPSSDMPLSHDGYLKVWALTRPTIDGDFILLDEAQDTNRVVLGVVRHQPGQVIAVGDRCQQIYAWRGAENAMETLPVELEARLSTSFRFGMAIAEYATVILELLGETVPLKGNPARVSRIGAIADPDAILTRANGRLIDELIRAIGQGKKPCLVGGVDEILRYVDAAEKLMAGQSVDRPLEFFGFTSWREVREAAEMDRDADLQKWVDLIDTHTPARLRQYLEGLPRREDQADVVLSTGHKSKGREWQQVRLTDDFLRGVGNRADQPKPTELPLEELRLLYVAVTRGQQQVEIPPLLMGKLAKLGGVYVPSPQPAMAMPEFMPPLPPARGKKAAAAKTIQGSLFDM